MLRSLQAFILVTLAASTGLLAGATVTDQAYGSGQRSYEPLSVLTSVLTTIDENWAGEVETTELVHGAASGMTSTLDRHSVFLDPEAYQKMREETDGMYFGIGIEVRLADSGALVTRVIPASPAETSGLRERDLIIRVGEDTIADLGLDEITALIRGPAGTAIKLTILRDDVELEKVVFRDRVVLPAVSSELFEPGYGYARIDEFQRRTAADLQAAIETMTAQSEAPLRGLVLDLRGNPGGLVDEAIAVTDLFLSQGRILEVRGKNPDLFEVHEAQSAPPVFEFPLIILVNGTSASASEIVAGSLQVHNRATLLGDPSFGKGSVQKIYEFQDGSALKLTTARYYLPDGRSIEQDNGLMPDVSVASTAVLPSSWGRLRQSIESLDLEFEERDALMAQFQAIEDRHIKARPIRIQTSGSMAERLEEDTQLRHALDLVRSTQ